MVGVSALREVDLFIGGLAQPMMMNAIVIKNIDREDSPLRSKPSLFPMNYLLERMTLDPVGVILCHSNPGLRDLIPGILLIVQLF